MFVRGTRDPFSSQAAWDDVLARIRMRRDGTVAVCPVEGGGHGLEVPGGAERSAKVLKEACHTVVEFVAQFVDAEGPAPPKKWKRAQ